MRWGMRFVVIVLLLGVVTIFGVLFSRPGEPRLTSLSPTPQAPRECPTTVRPTGDYCYPASTRIGDAIRPRSTNAVVGQWYRIEIGHCGLEWIVDFAGRFWEVVRWDTVEPPHSLINGDRGQIRLIGNGEAEYEGSQGEHVRLRPIDGPLIPEGCE